MSPCPVQSKNPRIIKIVYEEPIGLDVAFPEAFPFSRKQVRAISGGEGFVVHKKRENGIQL